MFETCNLMYFQTKYMFKTHPKYVPAQKKEKKIQCLKLQKEKQIYIHEAREREPERNGNWGRVNVML
jgi:hypothetical protein